MAQALQVLKTLQARQNRETQRLLLELSSAAHAGQAGPLHAVLETALSVPEESTELLALRPLVNEMRLQFGLQADLHEQLQTLLQRLRALRDKGNAALQNRQAQHLASLQQQIDVDALLRKELSAAAVPLDEHEQAKLARDHQWRALELAPKTVLLSFDDGPHPVHTPNILATLAEHKIKALFFQLGHNLAEPKEIKDGKEIQSPLGRNQELVRQMAEAGHAIGNHSYSHPQMPKLSPARIKQEIASTQDLLDLAVPPGPARTNMFRAPYGALNEEVLAAIEQQHLRLVLWNVDSLDWADPSAESIVQRVVKELERAGRGIVLMHDIHAVTSQALPLLIQALKERGYRFAHWNGQALEVPAAADEVKSPG
ncbi:peptidoglycan/xylan/chitin deacetylase (PgdA/CDA1 family) [Paucibacter oligotrophus]|uniref:Peptidoglycan/xylan/chitin deacetylase (PgdA/CDA1 family) n=1 Tax=Roseateles oligotrophus TaxID=1769250 RepID=A0A840LJB0_9BURK|nr:polysaccharide deacetylase family protein [Roseateles oligotrophus]MBB4846069.1 peptidoglycan/xylan/chitin deacetylase (PgdA/CDA1 family) [Roseateles oligotrophus]